jgi:hypothetical protein
MERAVWTLSHMSESATRIKPFFVPILCKITLADTLPTAGAEDRALLGSNLSADSGAKTTPGFSKLGSGARLFTGIGIKALNPRGRGDGVPTQTSLLSLINLFRPFRSFPASALSSDTCLRPQHLHEPIPLTGCRNHYSASFG